MEARGTFPLIVVTGLSGAGKSTALNVFEDLGFFCVDGLPVSMFPKLVGLFSGRDAQHRGLVLGMDLRQIDFFSEWEATAQELSVSGFSPQIVFLESQLDILVRRYATTRRPHPLECQDLGLEQALEKERKLLAPMRLGASLVLDTSEYSIHDLRRDIQAKWDILEKVSGSLRVHIVSFGFKYGIPRDCDLLFDMRFLPNPYFDESLKSLSGREMAVADYVLKSDVGLKFSERFLDFLDYLLPLYAQEGRYRVTVGIGCTGGRHRSVSVAEFLVHNLAKHGYTVTFEHRHVELM